MNNSKALVIIDMQKGSFTTATPRFDTEGVLDRINRLSDYFRKKRFPVVYVQHDGSKQNEFIPQTDEWELLDELDVKKDDIVISKYANDIFYKTNLNQKLRDWGIEELYITGCATDFCVEASIQSALSKDFKINVVSDAHTTADRPHMIADKVIAHYNWVWKNMIPTKGRIEVKSFQDIEEEMKCD